MLLAPPPIAQKCGDYAMNFPQERTGDREIARDVMRRNGCLAIRFEKLDTGTLIAHGYLSRVEGAGLEVL